MSDKRLLVEEPEFASVLKVLARQGSTLSPLLRQAWDSKDLRTMTKKPLVATAPHVSIVGHITRQEYVRLLNATELGNGFANRFVTILVRRSKLLPDGGQPVECADLMERLARAMRLPATSVR